MTQFRCRTCAKLSTRRIPPAECPRKDECDFEWAGDAAPPPASGPIAPAPPPPTPPQPVPPPPAHVSMVVGGRSWTIRGSTVLGRNGDLATEAFREDTSVSRRHCEIEPDDADGWALRALSTSSPTVLNGAAVAPGPAVRLPPGQNRLVLGGRLTIEMTVPGSATPASVDAFLGALEETIKGEYKP